MSPFTASLSVISLALPAPDIVFVTIYVFF